MLYSFLFILTFSTVLLNQVMAKNQLHLKGKVAEVLSAKVHHDSNGFAQIKVQTNLSAKNPHNIRVLKERQPASVKNTDFSLEKITLEVQ